MKLFRWNARATQLAQRNNMPIYYTIHTAGMLRHKSTTATWYVQYTARGRRRAELRVVVEWTGGPSTVPLLPAPAQSCMPAAILSRSRMDRCRCCRATSACSGDRSRQHVQPLPGAPLVPRILPPPPTTNHLSSTCRAPLCSFILIAPIIPSPLRHDLYYSRDAHTTPMFRSRPAARALRTARRSIRSYPQHPSSFLEQCRLHINVHTLAS